MRVQGEVSVLQLSCTLICGHSKFQHAPFHSSAGPLPPVSIIYDFRLMCFPKFSNVRGSIQNKANVFINLKSGRHGREKDTEADLCSLK